MENNQGGGWGCFWTVFFYGLIAWLIIDGCGYILSPEGRPTPIIKDGIGVGPDFLQDNVSRYGEISSLPPIVYYPSSPERK